jgi:uncharacterized protein YjbJ (UPF0337 family)
MGVQAKRGKGKTMGDPHHAANCKASWLRGEARKKINQAANEARAAANRLLREQGLPTPHEVQKAKRKAVRDAAREAGTLAPIGMTQAAFNKIPRKETA